MKQIMNKIKNTRSKTVRLILLAFGALLTGITLVYPQSGWITWISLIPSAIAIIGICGDQAVKKRALYGYGFFFFYCYFFVNFHWFVNLYPLDFIDGMTKASALAVVIVAWFGLSALQALSAGLVFLIFAAIVRGELAKRYPIVSAAGFAALWAILEWSQTLGWVGVPWARLSISQTFWLVEAQTVSLFGSCFLSFLIVFVNFSAAYAVLRADKRKMLAAISAGAFVLNTLLGCVIWIGYTETDEKVRIAAVQGNISSQEKWSSSLTQKTLDVYEEGTKTAALQGATVVVWPESALPYNLDSNRYIDGFASQVAKDNEVTLLVGAFTYDSDNNEYNSIIVYTPSGERFETVYSKRHLVPFGEFVPMRGLISVLIPPLTELSMLSEDLAEGESANIFNLEDGSVGSLICFDSIYDELARDSVREGAQVLAISTNDSWFLDSAALDMHYAQAKLRAIENGRCVVRSANTGLSGVISPRGETMAEIPPLESGVVISDVSLRASHTLYTYVGNTFVYLCALCVFVWVIGDRFLINKIKKIHNSLDKT